MSGGIEETILSNIEGATGQSFDDDGGEDIQQERGQPTQPDTGDQLSEQLNRRTRQPQPDDEADLREPLKQAPPKGKDQRKGPRTNQQGDIVDEQGNVLASRGLERRLHTQLERTREVSRSLEQRNQELARQLSEKEFLGGAAQKLGLDNDSIAEALQLAAQFKQSPVQAARAVIERALAAGVAMHEIVNDEFIPNVTLSATQRLLDQRLGPLSRNIQEAESVERTNREATEKGNRFLAAYPDAIHHQDVVAERMAAIMEDYSKQGVKMDPFVAAEKAFEQVLMFCQKHGLDISQPLKPQVEARRQQPGRVAQGRPGRGTPPQNRVRRPMPNGRGGGELVGTKSRSAGTEESYDAIIRDAMREEGYNL